MRSFLILLWWFWMVIGRRLLGAVLALLALLALAGVLGAALLSCASPRASGGPSRAAWERCCIHGDCRGLTRDPNCDAACPETPEGQPTFDYETWTCVPEKR